MRENPAYLLKTDLKDIPLNSFLFLVLICWSVVVLICLLSLSKEQSSVTPTPAVDYNLSEWVTSASNRIEQTRHLTLQLARDYQTVEFLADTNAPAEHLSKYWESYLPRSPYISRIGVVQDETNDLFYVGEHEITSSEVASLENELLGYRMQASLLKNNDILFNALTGSIEEGNEIFFRFTTPIHYEEMRLGHLYVDININKLLLETSKEANSSNNIIMLDSEGNYVAETLQSTNQWSAKQGLVENIGFYYPELWQSMNAMLSGSYSSSPENTYFSKLDIPWYENQIKYFYLIQNARRNSHTAEASNYWQPLAFIWVIGMLGFMFMFSALKNKEHKRP